MYSGVILSESGLSSEDEAASSFTAALEQLKGGQPADL